MEQQQNKRPIGGILKRAGCTIRPWKGPLPRPKAKPIVVLADFLLALMSRKSGDGTMIELIGPSCLEGNQRKVQISNVNLVDPGDSVMQVGTQAANLIQRAKGYGRSRIDLVKPKSAPQPAPKPLVLASTSLPSSWQLVHHHQHLHASTATSCTSEPRQIEGP